MELSPMKSRWSDLEFRSVVDGYVRSGLNPDLATRVYTTRLLGGDPQLVLHGGGNTSVKTVVTDADGGEVEVLCVKGSGWDMGSIEPMSQPLPLTQRTSTSPPSASVTTVLTDVLPPPCRTSCGSPPRRRVV